MSQLLPRLTAMADDWARPVVHWEIVARDAERQAAFYRELFNWEIGNGPILQIPAGLGGPEPGPGGPRRRGARPGVIPGGQVTHLRASPVRAQGLGRSLVPQPVDGATGPTFDAINQPD